MKFQLHQPQAINELGNRGNQEDAIYPVMGEASSDQRVFVVCDGMGGLDKGEVASAAVSKALGEMAKAICDVVPKFSDDDFRQCLSKAYNALDAADTKKEATMGTTMTFLCFHDGGCLVAHIGDSRVYHLRPSLGTENGVLFRTRDDSLVQQMYENGEITYEEMRTSPKKNIILKGMQPYQMERTTATLTHITDVKPGDYFYLCTDGMLEKMDDKELVSILASNESDEQKRQRLIDATVNNSDNHSAYLIQVKDVSEGTAEIQQKRKPVTTEPVGSNQISSSVILGFSALSLLAGIAVGLAVFM
ncbi:MAG: protein phosphatase 2C domain-containing protein [Prevotella sp.]|nr:protein phosphatase 2C domain-containing protein [Prevotella sp.]